jgi:hypothetical protein
MGEVTCFPESRRPGSIYGAVRPDQYKAAVDKACEAFVKKNTLQANEGRGSYVYQTKDGPVPYWFNVGVNTDGHYTCKDLKLEDPIGDGSHKCSTIFKDDIFGGCKFLRLSEYVYNRNVLLTIGCTQAITVAGEAVSKSDVWYTHLMFAAERAISLTKAHALAGVSAHRRWPFKASNCMLIL